MMKLCGAAPTCCCRLVRRPGRTSSSARCSPSNCSAPHQSLRTTLIIAKGSAMRRLAPVLIALPLLAAASTPVQPERISLDAQLQQARAEQSAAEGEAAKLERAAARAQGEAARLHAEQAAAAQSIEAAAARITAADAKLRLASADDAAHRHPLAEEQQPAAALVAGLAIMAGRPALLA